MGRFSFPKKEDEAPSRPRKPGERTARHLPKATRPKESRKAVVTSLEEEAPLVIQLAELDNRVNSAWPEYEADLKKHGVDYTMHMYPGTNHGFHNDSTDRYDNEQAELAWKRTIACLTEHLM